MNTELQERYTKLQALTESMKKIEREQSQAIQEIRALIRAGNGTGDDLSEYILLHCSPADPRTATVCADFKERVSLFMCVGAPALIVRTTHYEPQRKHSPARLKGCVTELFGVILSGNKLTFDRGRGLLDLPHDMPTFIQLPHPPVSVHKEHWEDTFPQ